MSSLFPTVHQEAALSERPLVMASPLAGNSYMSLCNVPDVVTPETYNFTGVVKIVTKKDQIRNEHVRGSVKVALVTKKITEKRLKWYRNVKRRDEGHMLRRMSDAPVPG